MNKKTSYIIFGIMGLIPSILLFVGFLLYSRYDMNPIDFIISWLPAILASPILMCGTESGDK